MANTTYGYDKNTDYSKLIEEAVKAGDMARAAIYEAQRNEKIAGEGLAEYQQTNQYASYLPGSYTGTGYINPYQEDLDAALSRLQDASAYKKTYLQEADRTMEDTLAQYGTMTGGVPSTQAVAAASQAADYYKSQLGEKLADLDAQNASLLLSAGSQAQSEYQMMISDALNRWTQLGYADDQVSQILGVAIGTPTSDQSYLNWQQGQQEKSDAYTMAMTLLQAGQMPSSETLAAAGISAEEAQMLLSSRTSSSGYVYSGSSSDGTESGEPLTAELWDELAMLYQDAVNSGDMTEFNKAASKYQMLGYNIYPFYDWIGVNYGAGDITGGYTGTGNAIGGYSSGGTISGSSGGGGIVKPRNSLEIQ